jgi:GH43 family beta-xylosidase
MIMFLSSGQTATKLLHLHTYKTIVVHKLYDADHEARVNFVNWYLHGMLTAEIDPNSFCLVVKPGFISVKKGTLR